MVSFDARTCNATNTAATDQSSFFDSNGIHWDAHRIGWVVAGAMAIGTVLITAFNIIMHCRYYTVPLQQRQIIRILLLPPVYAVVSFFSYRFFRTYTYYALAESVYEAIAIAAFLYLLVQYIGSTPEEQRQVLQKKDKRKIPIPFCCWRYRPSKPYFLNALKWGVLQYVLFRPLITIIGIICEATGKLCPEQYSIYFAAGYLDVVDFVVFSVALYTLIIFYAVTREQLKGRSPLAKFLTIKGVVFFTFYQGFIFSVLESHGVIKGTEFWTATNVANGLQALCTTVEMVIFSAIMVFSFSYKEYRMGDRTMGSTRAFLHSINFSDFLIDMWLSTKFLVDVIRGKPGAHSKHQGPLDMEKAFEGRGDSSDLPETGRVSTDRHMGAQAPSEKSPNSQGQNGYQPHAYGNGRNSHQVSEAGDGATY